MKTYLAILGIALTSQMVGQGFEVQVYGSTTAAGTYILQEERNLVAFLYFTMALEDAPCLKHLSIVCKGEKGMLEVNIIDAVGRDLDTPSVSSKVEIFMPEHVYPCTSQGEREELLAQVCNYLKRRRISRFSPLKTK